MGSEISHAILTPSSSNTPSTFFYYSGLSPYLKQNIRSALDTMTQGRTGSETGSTELTNGLAYWLTVWVAAQCAKSFNSQDSYHLSLQLLYFTWEQEVFRPFAGAAVVSNTFTGGFVESCLSLRGTAC